MTTENKHKEIESNMNVAEVTTVPESHGTTHEATLYAEHIGDIGPLPVTNSLLTSWIVVGIIVIFALVLKFKIKQVPKGIQNFFEFVIDGAMSLSDQVTGDRRISEKAFPFVFPVFIFILLSNWIGIMPFGGFGLIENTDHGQVFIPLIRSGTADINGNLALAIISIVGANIFGILSIGLWKTINKYVNLNALGSIFTKIKKDPMIILTSPIMFAIGFLELIGEFAKIASLSFRLFGNVFAGEVLLASMAAIVAYVVPIPFLILEVFVGVIQAFIFAILTLVYYTIASQDHEDHDEHEDHSKAVQDGAVAH